MTEKNLITPWDVKGDIDYSKLMNDFGVQPLQKLPENLGENILFRRKVIFAQRDLQQVLDCTAKKKPFVMMTGMMPTGRFHIGHMIVAKQFIMWQNLGARIYIAVADIEAYNARGQSLEHSRKIAEDEYIKNYIALGLKPENCSIYFQSERSRDAKKSNSYYRLQNLLAKHATFNEFRAVYGDITPGKMMSALLQASDMLHPQLNEFEGKMPVLVPVGIDQDPHLRLARDLGSRIPGFDFIKLSSTYNKFLPGLSGGKMSASDPSSFIALTDSPKEAEKKIKKYAFSGGQATVEEHRKKGGNPDVDVSFQYLRMFFEEDDKKLRRIHEDYSSGKMLSGELKQIAIEKIGSFLEEHLIKRKDAGNRISEFLHK